MANEPQRKLARRLNDVRTEQLAEARTALAKRETQITVDIGTKPTLIPDAPGVACIEEGAPVVLIPPQHLRAIRELGAEIEQAGGLKLANGYCAVALHKLDQALTFVDGALGKAEDPNIAINGARAIGYVAQAVATVVRELRHNTMIPRGRSGPRNRSFSPGQAVAAVQINIKTGKDE